MTDLLIKLLKQLFSSVTFQIIVQYIYFFPYETPARKTSPSNVNQSIVNGNSIEFIKQKLYDTNESLDNPND